MLQTDPTVAPGALTLDVGSVVGVAVAASQAPATTPGPGATSRQPPKQPPTATTIPTALGQTPSSASDQQQPFDPTACL
jgi:hypothetical protein